MDKNTFRGWDKVGSKGWVYGDLAHNKGLDNSSPKFLYDRVMVGGYEVDEKSVGQYTGLKDRNGKDIYEGDILMVFRGYKAVFNIEVVWHERLAGFLMDEGSDCYSPIPADYSEITGNRYENSIV